MLNKAPVGLGVSSLGIHGIKWDYDSCFKEAQKYEFKGDFKNNSRGAYDAAKNKNWLKDYTWLKLKQKAQGYWTVERCLEEAKKYKSRSEYWKTGCTGYSVLKNKGLLHLLNDIYGKPLNAKKDKPKIEKKESVPWNKKWDKQACIEESKKYSTINEFRCAKNNAYGVSLRNGWLDEFTWLKRQWQPKWNEDSCFKEAQKYTRIIDFQKNNRSAYNAAYKNGWLKSYTWLYENFGKKVKLSLFY